MESIEASFKSMEANKAFVRPYLRFGFFSTNVKFFFHDRVAHSYKMLENYNMSALALMKAKAMPITEQQASNVQTIKSAITKELGEVADEAKVAARDYMQRKGINNACKLDLQAARAARYYDGLLSNSASRFKPSHLGLEKNPSRQLPRRRLPPRRTTWDLAHFPKQVFNLASVAPLIRNIRPGETIIHPTIHP